MESLIPGIGCRANLYLCIDFYLIFLIQKLSWNWLCFICKLNSSISWSCLGMEGSDCSQDIDECRSSPCVNGGTCHNELGRYRCECTQVLVNLTKYVHHQTLEFISGFKGVNCEVDINECDYTSPSICLHNGSCTNTHGDYNCLCGPVYNGVYATGQFLYFCIQNNLSNSDVVKS